MTEQETMDTPNDTTATSTNEGKPAMRSKVSTKVAGNTRKKVTRRDAPLSDDQKRLARNAALREWRKKNADRVKAYMAEWRAKRKGKQPEQATPRPARSRQNAKPAMPTVLSASKKHTATKKPTSRKAGRK